MIRWLLHNAAAHEQRDGGDDGQSESTVGDTKVGEGGEDESDDSDDVGPTIDDLDRVITATILTQAAFRGYRLRKRLRMLPAREVESAIKALHSNAGGFRLLGMFLIFYALYFALVFTGFDIAFERAVEQGLRGHVNSVKFGPNGDRSHKDVSSLKDFHQWLQAFYLKTYTGTQLEDVCVPCSIRPPDEVCELCDFSSVETGSDSSGQFEGANFDSEPLTEECADCKASWVCGPVIAEACNITLSGGSLEGFNFTRINEEWESAYSDGGLLSTSSSYHLVSYEFLSDLVNMTALAELDMSPEGGVSTSTGHMVVNNVSDCSASSFFYIHGLTENMVHLRSGNQAGYDGGGYIADRNRIVGGMLLKFQRRKRAPNCRSSRGYYEGCLSNEQEMADIVPDGEDWDQFRPTDSVVFNEDADGYTILIDTGGFNIGLNFGYCSVLLFEDLEFLGNDTRSVSVQLVTFNGNERTAYGFIFINFKFSDGGEVVVTDQVSTYILRSSLDSNRDRARWIAGLVFVLLAVGFLRHDLRRYYKNRRLKIKHHKFQCCCGCAFYVFILLNIFSWMIWAAIGEYVRFESEFQLSNIENKQSAQLDMLVDALVTQRELALFAASYKLLFLATTMVGLHRLLFQKLTFHKRMSIVTDTLSRASTHLDHFLFVFVLVLLVFVDLTWLLIGKGSDEFDSLMDALRSMMRISLGESENFYPQMLEVQPEVGPVVITLFHVLVVVLLLNVVVAIILEAYRGVAAGMRDEDTIFQSLAAFVGMTLLSWRRRIRWAGSYLQWRISNRRTSSERPSLKMALQGSTGVIGVDGLPVVMVRRLDAPGTALAERQLSYNCPRYITVTQMQALIKATPAPSCVADRVVRRIVHKWVFHSDEKIASNGFTFWSQGGTAGGGSGSGGLLPMLRRRKK